MDLRRASGRQRRVHEVKKVRLLRMTCISAAVLLGILAVGNVLWYVKARLPFSDGPYVWTCRQSGALLRWMPARGQAFLEIPRAYCTSAHVWEKRQPAAANPFAWLYLANHSPPEAERIFPEAIVVNSPLDGLLSAYVLESPPLSDQARALIEFDWSGNDDRSLLQVSVVVVSALPPPERHVAMEKLVALGKGRIRMEELERAVSRADSQPGVRPSGDARAP